MPTLGDLERSVMYILWESLAPMSAYDLQTGLLERDASSRARAVTTVLTVLSRLETKGFVIRERGSRPHLYRAAATREEHSAALMYEILSGASDRAAVLEQFASQVDPAEAEVLRRFLGRAMPVSQGSLQHDP